MLQGCRGGGPASTGAWAHHNTGKLLHRTIAAPTLAPTPTLASTSGRAQHVEVCSVAPRQATILQMPGHERTAVVACAATQRATTNAAAAAAPTTPSQFVLLTDCGSPPSAADVQEVLPHLTPKQLADAVWCFAQHEVKPTPELMDAVAQEIHSKLAQFRAPDLSNTLWAFAMLKFQPTEQWWRDFERQVFGSLTELTCRRLANLLWAFAVLERRPSAQSAVSTPPSPAASESSFEPSSSAAEPAAPDCRGWVLDPLLAQSCAAGFSNYSTGSLHLLVWSLGKLHHAPPAAWLEGFLPAAEGHFFRFTPTELTNVVWALAKLGASVPPEWLDKLLLVAQWRFPSFPARLLSIVAWSTATLNHRPQREWLLCFEEQVRAKFLDFSGHELACVAWSLRRFGYSTHDNAVFYMLQKQQGFLAADFEILSNPKLLRQVLGWKAAAAQEEAAEGGSSSSSAGPPPGTELF